MTSDATVVTASTSSPLLRAGDVIGERWEIRAAVASDALSATYRGIDQETEHGVLVRAIAPGALRERDAQRIAARLRTLVGMGGPTLSPIREVEQEGARVFVVERLPEGASFRSVLDARRTKGQLFEPVELVPLLAHLHAALSAIQGPWFHGDLRAERLYVGADRVLLTGGFALAVLPGDLVTAALGDDPVLRRELAPEVAEGLAGASADRWSVARMIAEALTGAPHPADPNAARALGALGPVLLRYLAPDPAARPASLEPLLTALADEARAPIPRVPIESFSADEPPTEVDATELAHRPDPELARALPVDEEAGPGDTARFEVLDESGHLPPPAAARKEGAPRDLSGIDPALLAAASRSGSKPVSLHASPAAAGAAAAPANDLDPRFVRAALGVAIEEPSSAPEAPRSVAGATAPSAASAPLPAPPRKGAPPRALPPPPARKIPVAVPLPAKKAAGATQELSASELAAIDVDPPRQPLRSGTPRPATEPESTVVGPRSVHPGALERPQLGAGTAPVVATVPRPSASAPSRGAASASLPGRQPAAPRAPAPIPAPVPLGGPGPVAPAPLPRPLPQPLAAPSPTVPRLQPTVAPPPDPAAAPVVRPSPAKPAPSAPPSNPLPGAHRAVPTRSSHSAPSLSGPLVIGIATVLALFILGAAFWYRRAQEEAAREERIEERLRELRTP